MSNTFETVYSTNFFNIIIQDNSIIVQFFENNNLLVSSWHNGGYQENISHVINQSLEGDDYIEMENMSYDDFQKKSMIKLGLNPDNSAGITTAACMDNYAISNYKYEQLDVTTIITAGADKNAIKAGDSASFYEYNNNYLNHYGTINIITIINSNLEPGTLVNALITITEAKTSVLQDLKIKSNFSNNIATGTGTDGVCVISNKSSDNHLENAGKHSKLGELIAKSVQDALKKALYNETLMSTDNQKSVLSRLARFNVDFNTFYENVDMDIIEYAVLFNQFNSNPKNIAFISNILNLIDEIQSNLLELNEIREYIGDMIYVHLNTDVSNKKIEKIGDIIDLLIFSINNYLLN